MRWTVIYNILGGDVESFQITTSHDGKIAWAHAKEELEARVGTHSSVTLYAIVKGGNPIYSEWSD
jgi:hypothetical protein